MIYTLALPWKSKQRREAEKCNLQGPYRVLEAAAQSCS